MKRSAIIVLFFAVIVLHSCDVNGDSDETSRCELKCRADQICSTCCTACPPTCDNPKPGTCTKPCVKGCQCKPGLLTLPNGSCVEPSKCPPIKCRSDQVYHTCGTACPPSCDNPKPGTCTKPCVKGCQCKPGLLTLPNGSCVEPSKCPPIKCRSDQVYHTCGTACPPSCDNPKPGTCTKPCVKGCQCKPGLLTLPNGSCVEPSKCPPIKCRSDQVYHTCGTACPPSCDKPKPGTCTKPCVKGCQCKPGLLTLPNGSCVEPSKCPPIKCRSDQVYHTCGTACPPSCDKPKPGTCTKPCVKGCQCKPGLLTLPNGSCVEPSKCPPIKCRSDQVYHTCGTACPPSCDKPKPGTCTKPCVKGCQCKPGLLTLPNGSCVEPSKCPPIKCRSDQVYHTCGTACPPSCDNPKPGTCTKPCVKGCQCKPGLLTLPNGSCVEPSKCPPIKCRSDQVYQTCGTACPPSCDNPKPGTCTKPCVKGCQCKRGLYTQADGSCIKPSKCPKTCRPDQVCNCGGTGCPPTCANPKPKSCTKPSVCGCQCKQGLYTQADGSCIKPSECPK